MVRFTPPTFGEFNIQTDYRHDYYGLEVFFLGKQITNLEVTFSETNETTEALENYEVNLFGDFSYQNIMLFNIIFVIEFDDTIHDCDVVFKGVANPQRPNAYRTTVTIPGLSDQEDTFDVIFDLEIYQKNQDELEVIKIQIVDSINPSSLREDAYLNVTKQNVE